jgi:transcriptional regulator
VVRLLLTVDRSDNHAGSASTRELVAPTALIEIGRAPEGDASCPVLNDARPANGQEMSKLKTDLLQGTLDLMILRTLEPGPNHGWGISQRIQQVSQDVLRINQGSLYPALFRLEAQGWIASEWGSSDNNRRAKYYRLTRAGRRQLADETENWQRIAEAIARVLETA